MDLKKSDMLKTLVKLVEDDTQVIVNPDMVRLNSWQRLRGRCLAGHALFLVLLLTSRIPYHRQEKA